MSQQQLQTIIQMLKAQPIANPAASVQQIRAGFEQMGALSPVEPDIKKEPVNVGSTKEYARNTSRTTQALAIESSPPCQLRAPDRGD